MFIGYIQNNNDQADYADQYQMLNAFAQKQGFKLKFVHADSDFKNIRNVIQPDCEGVLVVRISNLGFCLAEVRDNLQFLKEKNLKLFSIDDGYQFDNANLTADFFRGMDMAMRIRRHLISQLTRKVLSQKKKEGKKLGRPFGKNVESKLENNAADVLQMLASGLAKSEISRRLGVSRSSIYAFAKRHGVFFNRRNKC